MKYLMIALMSLMSVNAFADVEVTKIEVTGDTNGSLAGKHFFVYDERDNKYCINLVVNGVTTADPTPSGAISVPAYIPLNGTLDDVAHAISTATMTLNDPTWDKVGTSPVDMNEDWLVEYIEMYPFTDGPVIDAHDGNTGFNITILQQGT
jgi:hypothetical protein